MKRLLILGCGDVAMRAIPLLSKGYSLYALIRDPDKKTTLREQGVIPLMGDLDLRASLSHLSGLADAVLYLAPPPNSGTQDIRVRNLLSALSRGNSRHKRSVRRFVYISTSGVYGDCSGEWVDETRPMNAQSPRAQRRADAEQQIRGWARRNGVNASILRVPGIYASDRLPLARIQKAMPAIIEQEDSYTNHIHADDLANICVAALQSGQPCRIYHACDDSHLKMGDYFDMVADAHSLPHAPRVSRSEAQKLLPESLLSFMNESRRLSNLRMKRELKVKLHYPTVSDMLAGIKTS